MVTWLPRTLGTLALALVSASCARPTAIPAPPAPVAVSDVSAVSEPAVSFHGDNETCGSCHKDIYDAWLKSRHAQSWTSQTFRKLSENYSRAECLPCHAPDLVLRTGIGARPALRTDVRDAGVSCIVCHQDATAEEWTMHGPYEADSPGHVSVRNDSFQTAEICASCHGQEEEFDQYHSWQTSEYGQSAFPCQACHMTPVEKSLAETAPLPPVRWVGDHSFPGAHNDEVIRSAVRLEVLGDSSTATVRLTNEAGHFFPGGAYREAVLAITDGRVPLHTVVFSFESGNRLASGAVWERTLSTPSDGNLEASVRFRRTVGDDDGTVIAAASLSR